MKKLLFLICLFALFFYSCAIRKALAPSGALDETKTFFGQMLNDGKPVDWFNVPAKLIKTTDNLAIYLQTKFHTNSKIPEDERDISIYALNKLIQEFDYYYDSMTNIYGEHTDIDNNSKIVILLMDINANTAGSRVLGYFNPLDMHGYNEGEILYMDLLSANKDIDKSIGTLLHEFQHLINYSHVVNGTRKEMEAWLNEALSESTSILFNRTTAESRMREFTNINYYCFYTWEIPTNISNYSETINYHNTLVNYPSASVFMHWLYNKNDNKSDIFKKIARSKQHADYMKVLVAAKEIPNLRGIEDWGDLLLTWMADIYSNKISPHWDSNFTISCNKAKGQTILYPGAMVIYNSYVDGKDINFVARTNSDNTIIHLNKDKTIRNYAPAKSIAGLNIIESKEENQIINILLDRNGNIKKY